MSTFYLENFGCRATQADGAAIARQFRDQGLIRGEDPAQAKVVVLNTCTVTASADQDARAAIRRIHRENPGCEIVVTGCYAQRAPQEIAALPGVTQVIGNSHKHRLAEIVAKAFVPLAQLRIENREPRTAPQYVSDIFAHTELQAAPVFEGDASEGTRTRPNLKIQDGCNNRCSFCVIPSVRGQSRSLPFAKVLSEVNALVEAGYREVVISGINLGRWGRDLPSWAQAQGLSSCKDMTNVVPFPVAFADFSQRPFSARPERGERTKNQGRPFENLIRAILNETTLEKLRLSSIEPMDWSDELIALMANSPRIAKHAHVPMQSGSDRILRLMHRKYRPWHYREKLEQIRAAMPTAAIGADVMVGFPGETDADFDATRRIVEELPFTYLHVFTYSSRPGTPSATMPDQVPVQTARKRNQILRDLASEKKQNFLQSFVGKEIQAITLNSVILTNSVIPGEGEGSCVPQEAAITEALTDNYLKLHLQGQYPANHWISAQVRDVHEGSLVGTTPPINFSFRPSSKPSPEQRHS